MARLASGNCSRNGHSSPAASTTERADDAEQRPAEQDGDRAAEHHLSRAQDPAGEDGLCSLGHHGPLLLKQVERVGAVAQHYRRRNIRITSTIITMRTTVPIPIYIDYSFPGSARYP